MAQELHKGIDADVGIGALGGEGVAQSVNECAGGSFTVDAGLLEGAEDAILKRPAGYAISVGTDEQGGGGRKSAGAVRLPGALSLVWQDAVEDEARPGFDEWCQEATSDDLLF